jgi:HAD superfamily hydrolase (TIGR01509 family)
MANRDVIANRIDHIAIALAGEPGVLTLALMPSEQSHGVLFDIDGTLVDSVYQHARVWRDVLAEHGFVLPHWQIHRGIGLPSDRLLAWLLGGRPKQADALIEAHAERFEQSASSLAPTPGALALLADLDAREIPYCAVSSAGPDTLEILWKALGRELRTAKGEGEKPNAEPLLAAAAELGLSAGALTMIGDAIWDGEAARRCGAHFIGLRCGGSSELQLRQAGALWVEDAPRDLIGRL